MSLTREQKKDLNQLSEYFKKIEKLASADNLDLDVYMSEYNEKGFSLYATETVSLQANAEKRKKTFEKTTDQKTKTHTKNQ